MMFYQAEFEEHSKKQEEKWGDYAEVLRSLGNKAFPDLQLEVRELVALQNLEQPQVAVSIKQRCPTTLDDAVTPTLETESYAAALSCTVMCISTLHKDVRGRTDADAEDITAAVSAIKPNSMAKVMVMLDKLMDWVENLE